MLAFVLPEGGHDRFVEERILACCVARIPWSRLVLGAHYLTDVVGGLLLRIGLARGPRARLAVPALLEIALSRTEPAKDART